MSQHRNAGRTPRMSARQYMTTAFGGAAMLGVGVLLASSPGAPAPTTAAVELASTDLPLPLGPHCRVDGEAPLDLGAVLRRQLVRQVHHQDGFGAPELLQ